MKLTFIRHGQTDLNKDSCIQGGGIDQPLNETGIKQATGAASHFNPEKYDLVFSSPLQRAKKTAEIFVKGKKKINFDERIKEMDFGEWDTLKVNDLIKKYPKGFNQAGYVTNGYLRYAPSGESFEDVARRGSEFIDELISKYPDKNILVVCHGTLIKTLVAHYFSNGNLEVFEQVENCAISEFEMTEKLSKVIRYNQILY
ncbi:histidine phosphatase family protein [Lactobacillus mulieris]|uniref:Histidine phosphatase family protein n=1 Tax=Lactobacillus mulieris TaxID=2508708 RepID=A0AAW5WXA4_9LACO|nr:histidine phosphatase family protein [Lactobacillus mulieris]MCZ3621819.1 histidine phosphatase family protein [Lactobacillus mulieris]MCZ3623516.1 histidine phosphatase family protein [Lactobacillus mulieris]MCZ3635826.1 histidine phosphatase family protein [Lactobacillus mulieris]MCZ3689614.1 histidine phosphatase family protein [Lactobacillus mulieris]MCZ3695617.1 histidine phosphatase family protein [Lactobacillus mulieris]